MAPQRKDEPLWPQKMFALEMRARREAAGLSRNRLAEALGCTPQWLAKVETYDKTPSEALADDLDTYFKAGGAFHRLWEEIIDARKRGLVPSRFRPLMEAEKEASQISIYEPLLMTGLLQTEEYARLVLSSGQYPRKAEERLAIRLERQRVLTKEDPPWLFVLLREPVIRDVRREFRIEQCKRLLDLMQEERISIQVIPTDAPVFQPSGFQVLNFDSAADIAYVDGAGSNGQTLTEPDAVRALTVLFNVIRSTAMSAEESENLISKIMEDT
ncbi:helix-turn-helix domain-containing protein [Actinocorallia populi]|uniref:helix-turn-helix domain-containing protein n=1 Tax=Actinocorallia populi TaxID=2079200 RepID=UPI000D094A4F|nr:helix-turn-helix transcriptional regulator [Actinocorallia populi]